MSARVPKVYPNLPGFRTKGYRRVMVLRRNSADKVARFVLFGGRARGMRFKMRVPGQADQTGLPSMSENIVPVGTIDETLQPESANSARYPAAVRSLPPTLIMTRSARMTS
jgi:hypothetical protein